MTGHASGLVQLMRLTDSSSIDNANNSKNVECSVVWTSCTTLFDSLVIWHAHIIIPSSCHAMLILRGGWEGHAPLLKIMFSEILGKGCSSDGHCWWFSINVFSIRTLNPYLFIMAV